MNEQLPFKASIKCTSASIYPDWSFLGCKGNRSLNMILEGNTFNAHSGFISDRSRKKMENIIKWFILQAPVKTIRDRETGQSFKFRVNFVTLTLPAGFQEHSDQDIKQKCLNHFLTDCRRFTGMKNYIWKAEPQANGAIHFHITTDAFIHWKFIRETWNRIIDKLGYVQDYRERQIKHHSAGFNPRYHLFKTWPLCKQYKAYLAGRESDWKNPNTTDVHSVKNIKDMPAYLSKYLSKADKERRGITGRIWGCNQKLSTLSKLNFLLTGFEISQSFYRFKSQCETKTLDHCQLIIYNTTQLKKLPTGRFKFYIDTVIDYLRDKPGISEETIKKVAEGEIPTPQKYLETQLKLTPTPQKKISRPDIRNIIIDQLLQDY